MLSFESDNLTDNIHDCLELFYSFHSLTLFTNQVSTQSPMNSNFVFPFGEPIVKIIHPGRAQKRVFLLGYYASSVHAKWISKDNQVLVKDLPVASEPGLFWTGDECESIISRVKIPSELGVLLPPDKSLNGALGRILDTKVLAPLKLGRSEVRFCNLVPYSQVYLSQRRFIAEVYLPLKMDHCLPMPNIPDFKTAEFRSSTRIKEITEELELTEPELLITLGDEPLDYFMRKVSTCRYRSIKEFLHDGHTYGDQITITLNGANYQLLPLCHPRQLEESHKLSQFWNELHDTWLATDR